MEQAKMLNEVVFASKRPRYNVLTMTGAVIVLFEMLGGGI